MNPMFSVNTSHPMPLYAQLERTIRFAVATGKLREGDQLPTVRQLAVDLRINANTVAKVYRELEHEGTIELRHGSGAFVTGTNTGGKVQAAVPLVTTLVDKLKSRGLSDQEIRRLFESALMRQEEPARMR